MRDGGGVGRSLRGGRLFPAPLALTGPNKDTLAMETLIYFLFWAAVIFLMMRFGCGSHIMGHRHGGGRSGSGTSTTGSGGLRWEPPEKDVDPVCGMTIETAAAKSAVHDGTVYYFCSQVCREKFEANPAAYLKKTAESSQPAEHSHEHRH